MIPALHGQFCSVIYVVDFPKFIDHLLWKSAKVSLLIFWAEERKSLTAGNFQEGD
jgi:hypothetical protein